MLFKTSLLDPLTKVNRGRNSSRMRGRATAFECLDIVAYTKVIRVASALVEEAYTALSMKTASELPLIAPAAEALLRWQENVLSRPTDAEAATHTAVASLYLQ